MKITGTTELNCTIYKVISHSHRPVLLIVSVNSFFEWDVLSGSGKQHVIPALEVILDIAWGDDCVFVAGIGSRPLVYNLEEQRVTGVMGEGGEQRVAFSALLITGNTLYCANIYSGEIEVWDIALRKCVQRFVAGAFVKQLLWEPATGLLLVAVAESEDSGYVLVNHIDKEGAVHCLDVRLDCYFSVASVQISANKKELLIAGGFPPLNVQVHHFPSLTFQKELVLEEDYPYERMGNETGYAFPIGFQWLASNRLLVPYSGGDLLAVDYHNNAFERLYSDGRQWIYAGIAASGLIAVSHEGVVLLLDAPPVAALNSNVTEENKPDFKEVDVRFPVDRRKGIVPAEEAIALTEKRLFL